MQGRMSQNFDLGPSFNFMKCRIFCSKNEPKVPVFLHKIETRTRIENLRHAFLKKNIKNTPRIFQIEIVDSD